MLSGDRSDEKGEAKEKADGGCSAGMRAGPDTWRRLRGGGC